MASSTTTPARGNNNNGQTVRLATALNGNNNNTTPVAPAVAVGAAAAVVSAFLRDPTVESKATKVADRLSENIQGLANEPSLAFYRIQEHVRKTVPQLVERKATVDSANARLEEACDDLHYGVKTISDLRKSTSHFANLADLLRHAAFYMQQLAHLQQQNLNRSATTGNVSSAASNTRQ